MVGGGKQAQERSSASVLVLQRLTTTSQTCCQPCCQGSTTNSLYRTSHLGVQNDFSTSHRTLLWCPSQSIPCRCLAASPATMDVLELRWGRCRHAPVSPAALPAERASAAAGLAPRLYPPRRATMASAMLLACLAPPCCGNLEGSICLVPSKHCGASGWQPGRKHLFGAFQTLRCQRVQKAGRMLDLDDCEACRHY